MTKESKKKLKFVTPTLANRLVVVQDEALMEEIRSSMTELGKTIDEIKAKSRLRDLPLNDLGNIDGELFIEALQSSIDFFTKESIKALINRGYYPDERAVIHTALLHLVNFHLTLDSQEQRLDSNKI